MGLNNTYNAKALYYYYANTDYRSETANTPMYLQNALTQFDFADLDTLYKFLETGTELIENFFMGGITRTYTIYDLINGWNSPLISEL
jgi:hypothetical protein